MALKLSIFTVASRADEAGDNYYEAMACYEDLADEVILNDEQWPDEFNWPLIGQTFQRAYEQCTGDWVIHADLDFFFHEKDFNDIRNALANHNEAPAISFWKYQFIQPDKYNLKSRLIIAVNKGVFGDRIKFNGGGDLCQPTLDGKDIKPDDVPESKVAFYNYEKLSKTPKQVIDDVERMDRAYKRHFDRWLYSKDGKNAYEGWLRMVLGRANKPRQKIELSDHPKYIQETIKNLTPDQFGYNAFSNLETNSYAIEVINNA